MAVVKLHRKCYSKWDEITSSELYSYSTDVFCPIKSECKFTLSVIDIEIIEIK